MQRVRRVPPLLLQAARALLWSVATWCTMGAALAAAALARGAWASSGPGGGTAAAGWLVAIGLPALVFLGGVVQLLLLPQLLTWACLGPALGRVEDRWLGVVLGAGVLAVVPAAMLTLLVAGAPRVETWVMVWACVATPRLVCRALRPGAFWRARPEAA